MSKTTMFTFASDVLHEGVDHVLDTIQNRAGVSGVTFGALYHHARDIFPHNPRRKVLFLEGDRTAFRPNLDVYRGERLLPSAMKTMTEHDLSDTVLRSAAERGMPVRAWAVFLHNLELGRENPDLCVTNAYGDPYVTDLCPSNEHVRKYAVSLATDLAGRGFESILAESLHFPLLDSGYLHERYCIDLGALGKFFLGICFCASCTSNAQAAGVDVGRAKRDVIAVLDRVFEHEAVEGDGGVEERFGIDPASPIGRFLEVRERTVSGLVSDVAAAVSGQARLIFTDVSGAFDGGFVSGERLGPLAVESSWTMGIDLSEVSRSADEIQLLGYCSDPERFAEEFEAYSVAASGKPITANMRAMLPDCETTENLSEKLRTVANHGGTAGFYTYGMMRSKVFDRIADAIRQAA